MLSLLGRNYAKLLILASWDGVLRVGSGTGVRSIAKVSPIARATSGRVEMSAIAESKEPGEPASLDIHVQESLITLPLAARFPRFRVGVITRLRARFPSGLPRRRLIPRLAGLSESLQRL
jgi:hypothetical protein